MQGKQEIIDDILQSAKKSAEAMISEAEAECREAIDAVKADLERSAAAADADADRDAAALFAGRVKLGELEAGKLRLAARRACVDEVYELVKSYILKMPDAAYLAMLKQLIVKNCSDGDEVIAARSDAKRVTAEWVKSVATAAKKKLTLSKDKGDFAAGVVLKNAKFDIDLTVDEIVADLKDRTVAQTTQDLGL